MPAPRSMPPAPPRPMAPSRSAAPRQPRPDANPMRLMLGMVGIATASALTAMMLPSVLPQDQALADSVAAGGDTAVAPEPSVLHVTRYVTLAPGQTAAPAPAATKRPAATPKPTPKPKTVTRTRQSGKP